MGKSSEITAYSLSATEQKEMLNFLSLLVGARKTHLESREKCPMMQLIMNIKTKKDLVKGLRINGSCHSPNFSTIACNMSV